MSPKCRFTIPLLMNGWMEGTPTPNTHSYKSFGSSGVIFQDTIYYFGGARSSGSFGIQKELRKGIINPDNPSEIQWSISTLANELVGYRMSTTISKEQIFWIGSSSNTYNFQILVEILFLFDLRTIKWLPCRIGL